MEPNKRVQLSAYEWIAGSVGLIVSLWFLPSLAKTDWRETLILFAMATLLEAVPVPIGKVIGSLLIVLPIGTMVLYGPGEAIWLMIVAELLVPIVRPSMRNSWSTRIFNAGQYALSTVVMWIIYQSVVTARDTSIDWRVFGGTLLGVMGFVAANHLFLHIHERFRSRVTFNDILELLENDGILVVIALPFSLVMMTLGPAHPFLAPVVMLPVALLSQTLRMYHKNSFLQRIHAVTANLTTEFDIDRLCEEVAKATRELTYAQAVAVHTVDENGNLLMPQVIFPVEEAAHFTLTGYKQQDGGVIWNSLRGNDWVYIPDTSKDSRVDWVDMPPEAAASAEASNVKGHYRSMAVFPMKTRGSMHGAIVCYATRTYAFGELSQHIMVLASQVAVLIENAKLYQKLQEQSWRDGATRLYNYRFFYEVLSQRIEDAVSSRKPVSVAVIDVDYFKKFNDTYGHLAGDEVLKSVGQLLADTMGQEAVVARYGGEEFAVIYPGSAEDTYDKLEYARGEVSRLAVAYDGYRLQGITVSSGIASCPEHGVNDRDLLLKADSAMYWGAKQRGRNRTAIYSPELDAQLFVDQLTGLYTYHFLNIRIREEVLRNQRRFGVICVDLDRFSLVNSSFGFSIGDKVLQEVSMILKDALRQTELVSRFDGDGFLIVIPNVGPMETEAVAGRVTKSIASHRFDCADGVVLSLRARHLSATFTDLQDAANLFERVGALFAELHKIRDESLG